MTQDLQNVVLNGFLYIDTTSPIAKKAVCSIDGERLFGYTDTPGVLEYNTQGIWIAPYPMPSETYLRNSNLLIRL